MTTKATLLLSICMLVLPGCSASARQAAEPAKATLTCPIKRSVLANGDLQIQNADCSLKVIPKTEVVAAPQEPVAKPQETTQKAQPQIDRSAPSIKAEPTPLPAVKSNTPAVQPKEIKPEALPDGEADPTLRARYRDSMIGYYDYHIAGYRHRQRVFEWQFISSIVIFILVVALVASGVYFAAIQFNEGMRRRAAALSSTTATTQSTPPVVLADDTVTTFSASATGISVSSPVLGVIILVISLAFFYLYLVYVYPISELF